MTENLKTRQGSSGPSGPEDSVLTKVLLSLARPRAVFAVVLSGVLISAALIMAIVAIGGGSENRFARALNSYAGWSLSGWTSTTRTYTGGYGSSSGCPTTVPYNEFQGCYYRHNGYDYFNSYNFVFEKKDPSVNFDWGTGSPSSSVPSDNFSAKWEGSFPFDEATYTFSVTKDDAMRVYVDGVRVFDRFYTEEEKVFSFSRAMSQGSHRIKVEYFETTGNAVAKLLWTKSGASGGGGIVPPPGGGGGTPVPGVTPYAIFTSDGLNDGSGNGYGVVSVCSLSDTGRYHPYNVESNVPVGVRLTEGSYSGIGSGSYIASKEIPDSDGKYRLSFRIDGSLMPNATAIKFGLFSVVDAREIGAERGATSRNDDCATYTLSVYDAFCSPSGYQLNTKAEAKNAETGKIAYMRITGPGDLGGQRAELKEVSPGNYSLDIGFTVDKDGDYKVEYYFNNYLRKSVNKTISVTNCGPSGFFNDRGGWGYNICDGEFKDVTVDAYANRPGRVADVQNNTVFTLTQQGSQYYGSGTFRLSSAGATLFLTLLDGPGLTPIAADQTTFVITKDGCAGSVSLFSGPATVELCSGETKAVQVSATSTVPTRIFVNGLNYNNTRISGSASTSPTGSFNATLGAGGASTIYTVTVVDNNGTVLHSHRVDANPSTSCTVPLSLSAAQGFNGTCGYNNYQASSGQYLVLWGTFPATGLDVYLNNSLYAAGLGSYNGNQINVPLQSGAPTGNVSIKVKYNNQETNSVSFPITSNYPYLSSAQGYDHLTGMYDNQSAERGKYLVLWGNFCDNGNQVNIGGMTVSGDVYNGNQLNVQLPVWLSPGYQMVTVGANGAVSNSIFFEIR